MSYTGLRLRDKRHRHEGYRVHAAFMARRVPHHRRQVL